MRYNLAVVPTLAASAANLRTTHGKEYAKLADLASNVENALEGITELNGYKDEPDTWSWSLGGYRILFSASNMHPDARAAMDAVPAYDGTNADAIRAALLAIKEKASFAQPLQMVDPDDKYGYKGSKVAPGPWRHVTDCRKDRAEEEAKAAAAAIRNAEAKAKEDAARFEYDAWIAKHPQVKGMKCLVYTFGGEFDLGSDYGGYVGQGSKVVGFYDSNRREEYLRAAACELFKAGAVAVDFNAADARGYVPRFSDYSHDLCVGSEKLEYGYRGEDTRGITSATPAPRHVAPGVYVLA